MQVLASARRQPSTVVALTRRLAAAAFVGFAGAALIAVIAPAASGATMVQSGWWTTAPVAVAPDAGAQGLVVQGGTSVDQPLAFAAVSFTLDPGSKPTTLTLTIASGSASTPNAGIVACALTASFAPAQGGPAASGPTYNCATKVDGVASGDGSSYAFDVSAM